VRAFVAALLLIAAAGCGGEGGNDRLTKNELLQQANAICADYAGQLKALGDPPQTLSGLATYARSAHGALADDLARLRKLHPPAELQAKYDAWLAAGDRALSRIDELGKAAAKGDQIAIQRLVGAAKTEDEQSDRLATELGMSECAND
jgi:hypothetical protein